MDIHDIIKDAVTIREDARFSDALRSMVTEKTNSLLVVNEDGLLAGEVSVSDLLDAIVPEYLDGDSIAASFATEAMFDDAVREAADRPVRDFMNADVETVGLDDSLMHIATTAIEHKTARLPIVDANGRPVGIISRRGLKHILMKHLSKVEDSA